MGNGGVEFLVREILSELFQKSCKTNAAVLLAKTEVGLEEKINVAKCNLG